MDKKNITPNPQQPVDRQPVGKLPNLLAELEESSLSGDTHTIPQYQGTHGGILCSCSYDGDEE